MGSAIYAVFVAGFANGSTALTVFAVDAPEKITVDKLKQYAFTPIDQLPEARGSGGTSFDDMFDTRWERSVPEKGGYLAFALRVDTRKVPAAVLKKHLAEALWDEEDKARSEGRKVSRGRKKELK